MPKSTRTLAQIEASRENGKKSNGPKDTSKTRHNAIKHGILADVAYCQTEADREAFEALRAALIEELAPETQMEQFYAERIAQCMWRTRLIEKRMAHPYLGSEQWHTFGRYDRMVSRELTIAEDKLEALQTARRRSAGILPASQGGSHLSNDSDETNPSAGVGALESAAEADPGAAELESLRRVTRVFEIIGDLSDDDRNLLRSAARSHLATVMPELELITSGDAAKSA